MIQIDAKEYVKSKNFNPSKKMGQNFLVNENIITEIIESISFDNIDTIIEIGPGLGALTKHLVNTNKPVICIELDKRLYSELKVKFKDVKNLTLINNDVLREDFDFLTQNTGKTMIVSNLPYSISSLVIVKFLKCKNIDSMYCMLQKEMAQRLIAKPRQKEYNSFSVLAQYQSSVKFLVDVNKNNFYPMPEVDSSFISISKNKQYEEQFDKFLKIIFSSKRKTLNNNLKARFNSNEINSIFEQFNLLPTIRSEELNPQQIHDIFKFLNKG